MVRRDGTSGPRYRNGVGSASWSITICMKNLCKAFCFHIAFFKLQRIWRWVDLVRAKDHDMGYSTEKNTVVSLH